MAVTVLLLLVSAVAIYLSCELFVNAVEWLGRRLQIGRLAVGTLLAAIGTALPESVVTFVAVVFGSGADQKQIGIGAAMGGPLVLSTISYAVVGGLLLARSHTRRARPRIGAGLARDQAWFMSVFVVKVGLGLVAFAVKPWLGLLFLATYGVYFVRELRNKDDGEDAEEELEPLRLQRHRAEPANWAVAVQTLATLVVIFVASQVFVHQLDAIGPALGLPPAVVALLLSPIATELPETMNAIIWVRQGKTPLALANISGAMMIQATVPSAFGLLFTPWLFDGPLLLSGVITMIAIGFLYTALRTGRLTAGRLLLPGALYVVFGLALIPLLA